MLSDIKRLWKAVQDLQRRVTQRPEMVLPQIPDQYILVEDGNTLDTGQVGCAWVSSVTELPSAYDPTVTSSFIDGIARGRLFVNGVERTDKVLIVNDGGGSYGHALLGVNAGTDGPDKVWALGVRAIPVAGGGSKSVYVVG